jgi:hypothetical protein
MLALLHTARHLMPTFRLNSVQCLCCQSSTRNRINTRHNQMRHGHKGRKHAQPCNSGALQHGSCLIAFCVQGRMIMHCSGMTSCQASTSTTHLWPVSLQQQKPPHQTQAQMTKECTDNALEVQELGHGERSTHHAPAVAVLHSLVSRHTG